MNITAIVKESNDNSNKRGYVIHISKYEAIDLIASITEQIKKPEDVLNIQKVEIMDNSGDYFSIAVDIIETEEQLKNRNRKIPKIIEDLDNVEILNQKIKMLEEDNKRMNDMWATKFNNIHNSNLSSNPNRKKKYKRKRK